ncbi:MAG: phytanoyl-CoA dioxygenase family protein [Verrucomicrobiota bacterium]|nr:phytanoyl-CoA dioxygenase family protein [Verrucomicrobiota bacterium]
MTQREIFEQDGFVSVPSFCTDDELFQIETAVERFIVERVPALPPEHVFYENKANLSTLKQIQRLHEHDDFFKAFFDDKPRRLAEELLGETVDGKNVQYFNKPPSLGQATPPHQDGFYFMLEPCHALTIWVALDVVDEDNGCVRYVRGSHIHGMRPHGRTQTLGFSQGITDFGKDSDQCNEVACPARPGDLLAHHALTIHRAEANSSATRNRRALGFIFYANSAREDFEAHEQYQSKLAIEMVEAGKI